MKRFLFLVLACVMVAESAWAFPTNAVLDSFTGCVDGTTPPNANWTALPIFGQTRATACKTAGATTSLSGNIAGSYWNPTTFTANQEAYATVGSGFGNPALGLVYLRFVDIGAGTSDGYALDLDSGGATLTILRITNGSSTLLGTGVSITPASGDKFGMSAIGTQICSWYKTAAGSWTQKECVTDSTYTAAGRIGMGVSDSVALSLDDFGGGNLSSGGSMPLFLSWLLDPITAALTLLEPSSAYAK